MAHGGAVTVTPGPRTPEPGSGASPVVLRMRPDCTLKTARGPSRGRHAPGVVRLGVTG